MKVNKTLYVWLCALVLLSEFGCTQSVKASSEEVQNVEVEELSVGHNDIINITPQPSPQPTPSPTPSPTPQTTPSPAPQSTLQPISNAPSSLAYGTKIGKLRCDQVGLCVNLYWSGSQSVIDTKNSAICDPYRNLPWNGPALLADHNTQDFDAMYDMKVGDIVYIDTQWGRIKYSVSYVGHAYCQSDYGHLYTDSGVDVTTTSKQLAMYTCYPRYSTATSLSRYVVLGDRLE